MLEEQTIYVTQAPFDKREKEKHQALVDTGWIYNSSGGTGFYQSPDDGNYYAPQMAWHLFCQIEVDEDIE